MRKIWGLIKTIALSGIVRGSAPNDEIRLMQERFLRMLLYISAIASVPAIFIASKEARAMGDHFSPLFYLTLFVIVVAMTLLQNRMAFFWKTSLLLAVFFAFGFHNLIHFGFSGAGIHIFLIISVLMTVLLGQRAGILTLIAGLATIVGVGMAMSTGVVSIAADLNFLSKQMISWLTAAGVFVFFAGAGVLIPGKLQNEMVRSLEAQKIQSNELSRANAELKNEIIRRKQAEDAYRLQALVLDQIQDRVTVTDLDGHVSYVNKAEAQAPTFSQKAQNQGTAVLCSPDTDKTVSIDRIMKQTKQKGYWHGKISGSTATGNEAFMDCRTQLIHDTIGNPVAVCFIATDTTEQVRLEKQLNQAQKMESVGRLAGGVAHDFNNMLSIINGYAELCLDQLDPAEPIYKNLHEIHSAGNRSAAIVRQLLAFARKQTASPLPVDLNETISNMVKMLQRLIGENIHLQWYPGNNLWKIRIDPSQIDQIMANLAVNARDAISDVGRLIIETKNVVFDDSDWQSLSGLLPGQYVMLAVSDNGCGMTPKTMDSIFEPFFTTKTAGEGTGLGLSTIYGIVKQNNGFINAYSEPGEGTSFKIYLPRHTEKQSSSVDAQEPGPHLPTGSETVLVVEDETAILQLTGSMLEKLGYTVINAESPKAALHLAETYGEKIDLLITDVIMPEMNGRALFRQLSACNPEIRALYMSGYTSRVIAQHGVLEKGVQFIQKPFSIRELALKVRQAVEPAWTHCQKKDSPAKKI